ncbi:hypothetical protein HWV62_43030 [Athelia sp. TMB]|nr:hypothetical protein HWV62_43030 [Athelia sp. TMB]
MENDSPRRRSAALPTIDRHLDTDRENWASLPTLSQLTVNNGKRHNNGRKSPTKAKALMDSGKGNNVDGQEEVGEGSETWAWEERSGLMTPPSSQQTQDVSKMLISPPPEEVLRTRSHHKQNSITNAGPFTPSLLNGTPSAMTRPASANSKRKRPGPLAVNNPSLASLSTIISPLEVAHDDVPPPEATPNPKPRKQSKRHARTQSLDSPTRSSFVHGSQEPATPTKLKSATSKRILIQSPHALNPDADFMPPMALSASASTSGRSGNDGLLTVSARTFSRRSKSTTPIPHYEPPTEVFTPPREITISPLQPPASRSRRKSHAAPVSGEGSVREKKVVTVVVPGVKKEMPDVDLSTPMPPPSPGDDPLLLSGRPRARQSRSRGLESSPSRSGWGVGRSMRNSSEEPAAVIEEDEDMDETMQFDLNAEDAMEGVMAGSMPPTSDSAFDFGAGDGALPTFDLNAMPDDGGWSDSDDEDVNPAWGAGNEGEGEYTGRFRMMKVPTKADPPTSGTRERMDEWGRPISPFPGVVKRRFSLPSVGEQDVDPDDDMNELPVLDDDDVVDVVEEDAHPQAQDPIAVEETVDDSEPEASDTSRDEAGEAVGQGGEQQEESFDAVSSHQEQDVHLQETMEGGEDASIEHEVEIEIAGDVAQHLPAQEEALLDTHPIASEIPATPARVFDESFSFSRELSVEEEEELEEESVDRELSCQPDPEDERREAEIAARKARRRSPSVRWESSPLRFPESMEPFPRFDEEFAQEAGAEVDHSSSEEEEEVVDDGVLTITSLDPLVAARAAAILKQHDYDLVPKIVIKHRRLSQLTSNEVSRNLRRKSLADGGIIKSGSSKAKRRATLGGMVGDRVFIPGSPAMTLPQLLMHAEEDLGVKGILGTPPRKTQLSGDAFKAPFSTGSASAVIQQVSSTREWTKDDWKQLDACFTDERLDVGEKQGLNEDTLAEVDDIQIECVVDRFLEIMGGAETVEGWGPLWNRDCLTTRAHALEKKQRAGHHAPPTPSRSSPSGSRRLSEVPNFTPLTRRRPQPPARRPKLPPPTTGAPFDGLESSRPPMHGSLLAPRYSHLLEEAISISHESPQEMADEATDDAPSYIEPDAELPQSSPGLSNRVKGFIFSYLPTLSKTPSATARQRKTVPKQPGLPLPPPEVLGRARGPISTPMRPQAPKPIPPKEQVQLQPAPPVKKSALPRLAKPQRMVNLNPTPAPLIDPIPIQRSRRSSGGSVKDLVRNFENLDRQVDQKQNVQRVRNVGECNAQKAGRPAWKP